jgi:two-component system, OmpR family, phosphate regulon sensor histidine kinase PhoR
LACKLSKPSKGWDTSLKFDAKYRISPNETHIRMSLIEWFKQQGTAIKLTLTRPFINSQISAPGATQRKIKIRYSDPGSLSIMVSLAVTFLAGLLIVLLALLARPVAWFFTLQGLIIFFLLSYWIFRFSLEKFIYEKIRIIYKTIHSLKRPKDAGKLKIDIRGDTIELVNREVLEWGQDRTKEIEELKRLAVYRREFIGNVSHELKSPIFNIQGYVLTLLDGGLEDGEINKEYLRRAEKNINRLIAIVEDLEAIAQLESGELKINFGKFELAPLVRDVIDSFEIKAWKKNYHIYLAEPYEKPVYVFADIEKIRQVLVNLIDNSIKYGRGQHGKTKVSFFDMDEHILIEVTDNGIGINQQDIPRVFERFYRTDKGRSREQGGTGLGLAIVKHIIEAHKQTISVRSTIDVGTTFGFTLKKWR